MTSRWVRRALFAGAGVAAVVVVLIAIPDFVTYKPRQKAEEAKRDLYGIRMFVLSYFDAHQKLLEAGPVPREVPAGVKVAFVPDEGFDALEWKPEGLVRHQYEVRVMGPRTAVAIARGDTDADGKIAEYRLVIDADDRAKRVEVLTPEVY